MSLATKILIALVLGLASGIGYSLSEASFLHFLPTLIEPIGTLWVNAIRMTVIPLLMALLLTAIANQNASNWVASLGAKSIGLFFSSSISTRAPETKSSVFFLDSFPYSVNFETEK